MVEQLDTQVHAYIRQHGLIAPGDQVVVAVSGGADSLCLLHVLRALAPALGCHLHVAHLDHALRAGSADDARFVAAHAAELGLPYTLKRREAGLPAPGRRLSLEAAARAIRYRFLRDVAGSVGAAAIATGHTRDDQAETLLLHLARGSGLNGVAGMLPRRDDVIRPLLGVSHAQTVAYCVAHGVTPRDDESNRSPAHVRNRVRHEILPLLEEIQPNAGVNIARAARLLGADLDLIERLARRALEPAIVGMAPDAVRLSAPRWCEAEPELRPHMLRLALVRLLGHAEAITEGHYSLALRMLEPEERNSSLMLPHGLVLARQGDEAVLGWSAGPLPPLGTYLLPIPGNVATEVGLIRAEEVEAPREWSSLPRHVAYLGPAATGARLIVRAWHPGDRIQPLGLGGSRKVQDLFVDRKVPRAIRQRTPIVEGPCGVAWVAGLCLGAPYRAIAGAPAVRLEWEPVG